MDPQNETHVEEHNTLLPVAKHARFTEPLPSSSLSGMQQKNLRNSLEQRWVFSTEHPKEWVSFAGVMGLSPAPVGFGLALGLGVGHSTFTVLQLQELEHQALIFRYMVAGVPIPFHLVLPIWKSVASSSASLLQHHPSMLGSCGNVCFDYRNNMEPEPGRCRRTDGKKWRCSKDVVPDQKYCERHMHRGRHRSRKHVEIHNKVTPITESNTNLSISIPVGLDLLNTTTTTNNNNNSSSSSSNGSKSLWNYNNGGNGGSVANSPRVKFSPTSVLQKGCGSISETSSNSKTESAFCFD